MNRKLFVGNFPLETTEADLTALFASAGGVSSVSLVCDRESGRPRGAAFVEMVTDEGATSAIDALHSTNYEGRSLSVRSARLVAVRRPVPGFDRPRRRSRSTS